MAYSSDEIIYSYTAKQAVADGLSIEFNPGTAQEAGFKLPVILTRAAYEDAVEWSRPGDCWMQDAEGRWWDVLTMARSAALKNSDNSECFFRVLRISNKTAGGAWSKTESPTLTTLTLRIELYDAVTGEKCIVIGLPDED